MYAWPAYKVEGVTGSITRSVMNEPGRPLLRGLQFTPVGRLDDASKESGRVERGRSQWIDHNLVHDKLLRCERWPILAEPPSVLLKTPPPKTPAYTVDGVSGSNMTELTFAVGGPSGVHWFTPASSPPTPITATAIQHPPKTGPILLILTTPSSRSDPPEYKKSRCSVQLR